MSSLDRYPPRPLLRAVCLVGLLVATPAAAEELPTVTMTRTGPDKVLPLGEPFFLAGEVGEHAVELQPIFVRISYPALGAHLLPLGPRSCDEAQDALGERREADKAPVGQRKIAELWNGNPDKQDKYKWLSTWHDALALPPWERQENESGKQEFKILVSGSFFRPGSRYCLFFYEKSRLQEQDKRKVKAALLWYAQKIRGCRAPEAEGVTACEQEAGDGLFKVLEELTAKVPPEKRGDLLGAVKQALVDAAAKLLFHPKRFERISQEWHTVFNVTDPTEPAPIQSDPLARLIATLMARSGALLAIPAAKASSGGLRHWTPDGKLEIKHLALLENFQGVRLLADRSALGEGQHRIERSALDKYVLPDSTVTLLDLLELSRGRIRVDKSYLAIGEAYEKVLKDSTGFSPGEVDPRRAPAPLARRDALITQVAALQQVLERAWKANANSNLREVQEVPAKEVYQDVGRWLSTVLAHCGDMPGLSNEMRAAYGRCDSRPAPPAATASSPNAWPGFNGFIAGPLGYLDTKLAEYRTAEEGWTASTDKVVTDLERTTEPTLQPHPLDLKLGYTQETWFFSYVTPVVGRGFVYTQPGQFNLTYAGAQLYLWPNEIHEPMWTKGWVDLRRVLALEVGVGLASTGLGAEGRFSGAYGLPPLMIGASAQLLPYLTRSGGWVLLGARKTTLEQESPTPFWGHYLSLTVQANIPDLFNKAARGGLTFTAADATH